MSDNTNSIDGAPMTNEILTSLPVAANRDLAHNTVPSPRMEMLQGLVDEAAVFNILVTPMQGQAAADVHMPGNSGSVIGIQTSQNIHRFEIGLMRPATGLDIRARNTVGEIAGKLDLRWMMIPYNHRARPGRDSAATALDNSGTQRFAMQEMTFRFGNGVDGFTSFGTGRTFPSRVKGTAKLVVAAIGNIEQGFGKFSGCQGNFTLCGELVPNHGFLGHIVVRILDPHRRLRTSAPLPPIRPQADPDPDTTYFMWIGQKGDGPEQVNRISLGTDEQVRGVNIATASKWGQMDFAVDGPAGFRCSELKVGEVLGREIGCGRGADPGLPPVGTAMSPFPFEGVAQYDFLNLEGRSCGAITTNVLEGRRFDMKFLRAPDEPATRFGFFGPVVSGNGYLQGVEGMLYGASASVFELPPGDHVITHLYMGRLIDPNRQYRDP